MSNRTIFDKLRDSLFYSWRLPERLIILLANPRSGSTWLLDALRSHPAIYMLSSGVIYKMLDLSGRRYPRDLCDESPNAIEIEVRPERGEWSKIPDFSVAFEKEFLPACELENPYAIEKCHPHFFDYDADRFLGAVNRLEKNVNLQIIYQVRDPKASLDSFYRYQKRTPTWNSNRNAEDVVIHMGRIYRSIFEIASKKHGIIVDYADIVEDFQGTIFNVFERLWPGEAEKREVDQIWLIRLMKSATDREKRNSKGKFLGKRQGLVSGSKGGFDRFFFDHEKEINHCYQSYNSLLKLKEKYKEKK